MFAPSQARPPGPPGTLNVPVMLPFAVFIFITVLSWRLATHSDLPSEANATGPFPTANVATMAPVLVDIWDREFVNWFATHTDPFPSNHNASGPPRVVPFALESAATCVVPAPAVAACARAVWNPAPIRAATNALSATFTIKFLVIWFLL